MSQQNGVGSQGCAIYPQKFVRLVGCHVASAADLTWSGPSAVERNTQAA
jgi:hypothetical protein